MHSRPSILSTDLFLLVDPPGPIIPVVPLIQRIIDMFLKKI
jgi:hypothetical protein